MLLQTLKVSISWIPASTLWGLVYFMDEEKRHSSVHPRTLPSHARGRLRTWIQNSHFELLENSISLQDLIEGLHASSFIHSPACSLSQQQTHSLFSDTFGFIILCTIWPNSSLLQSQYQLRHWFQLLPFPSSRSKSLHQALILFLLFMGFSSFLLPAPSPGTAVLPGRLQCLSKVQTGPWLQHELLLPCGFSFWSFCFQQPSFNVWLAFPP